MRTQAFAAVVAKCDHVGDLKGVLGWPSSRRIPSHRIPSHRIPSHRIPSHHIPSHRIPSARPAVGFPASSICRRSGLQEEEIVKGMFQDGEEEDGEDDGDEAREAPRCSRSCGVAQVATTSSGDVDVVATRSAIAAAVRGEARSWLV